MDYAWIDDNRYSVGNYEYGYNACELKFYNDFVQDYDLDEDDKIEIVQHLTSKINEICKRKE